MLHALLEDVAALAGHRAVALWDKSLGAPHGRGRFWPVGSTAEHTHLFQRLAADSDWTVLIAPELDGLLLSICRQAEQSGARLLSPGSEFVALASDKNLTSEALRAAGLPVPPRMPLRVLGDGSPADFPLVLKPVDGAGSVELYRLDGPEHLPAKVREVLSGEERPDGSQEESDEGSNELEPRRPSRWRLERWLPGRAVSVGVLNGPGPGVPLPACRQFLSADGRFEYQGGATPLDEGSDRRARRLAARALAALPPTIGFVGVDLVLGDDPAGGQDAIIEVNPRLTTSYVGLRASLDINLVEAMEEVARGGMVDLPRDRRPVQFEPDGTVRGSG